MPDRELGFSDFSKEELEEHAQRTVSDTEFIEGGAEYVNAESRPRLELTKKQVAHTESSHRIEEEIKNKLPIGTPFRIVAEPNPDLKSNKPYIPLWLAAQVQPPNVLTVDGQTYYITGVDEGMSGKVVAVGAELLGEDDEPKSGRPKKYFFTDVLADDKNSRLSPDERAHILVYGDENPEV